MPFFRRPFNRRAPKKSAWAKRKKPHYAKKKHPQINLTFLTWNVEGKGTPEKIDTALTSTGQQMADVVCLQETCVGKERSTEHYEWYCSDSLGPSVAILVSKARKLEVAGFQSYSEKLCSLEVTKGAVKMKVICSHIPPVTDYYCEDSWNKLTEIVKEVPTDTFFVIGGDFNAQIGKTDLTDADKSVIGIMLHHDVSDVNGNKLKKLARTAHLKVISSYTKAKPIGHNVNNCFTYKNDEEKIQRDYFLIPSQRNGFLENVDNHWHSEYAHGMHFIELSVIQIEKEKFGSDFVGEGDKPVALVGSWNISGAMPTQVDSVLQEQGLPLVCVQGLFLTSDDDLSSDTCTWMSSKKLWAKNVAIVLKKSPEITVTEFSPMSEFLCVADIVFYGTPMKVISCQLPLQSDPQHESTLTRLTDLLKSIPKESLFFLGGDFSAKIDDVKTEEGGKKETPLFVIQLSEETEVCSSFHVWRGIQKGNQVNVKKNQPVTRVTETEAKVPNYILLPWNQRGKRHTTMYVRWIPFFENCILCVVMRECVQPYKKPDQPMVRPPQLRFIKKLTDKEGNDSQSSKREVKNGKVHKITISEFSSQDSDDDEATEQDNVVVSPEDIEKFKNTPPSPEDLCRILNNDFVLFWGPNKRSNTGASPVFMLANSFKRGGFGNFTIEDVEVMDKGGDKLLRRLTRIKWKGLTLVEMPGKAHVGATHWRKKAITRLINNLSQTFCTIKGRRSFFNKGLAPVKMDDLSLSGVIKKVDKTKFPTMEEVFKHIDEFIATDSNAELVFGKDFTESEFGEIRKHAKSIKAGYRVFSSTMDYTNVDHMAVFNKRTPQFLRDMLTSNPKDDRYLMIPACGFGGYFVEFNKKFMVENFKDELTLIQEFREKKTGDNAVKKPVNELNKPAISNPSDGNKTQREKQRQKINGRQVTQSRPVGQRPQLGKPVTRAKQVTQQSRGGRSAWANRTASRPLARSTPLDSRSRFYQQSSVRDEPPQNHSFQNSGYTQQSRQVWQSPEPVYQQNEITQSRLSQNTGIGGSKRPLSDSGSKWGSQTMGNNDRYQNRSSQDLGGSKRPLSDSGSKWGSQTMGNNDRYQNRSSQDLGGSKRPLSDSGSKWGSQTMGNNDRYQNRSSQDLDSQWNDSRQSSQSGYFESSSPQKRARWDSSPGAPRVMEPIWRDLETLVIVWPITVRSKLEDRPTQILQSNFVTDFIMGQQNSVAVVVALPMRNGSEKKYCLSIGEGHFKAAQMALDIISKHSTIIKPHQSFLCNGLTPNFVRYKVPCQTNPRTYIILTKRETGPLNASVLSDLFENFKISYNEDVYFDKDGYTYDEKMMIVGRAPSFNLQVRHFGDSQSMTDRYVCVYKMKSKQQLLEDVLSMRGYHPKYTVISQPQQKSYNSY